MAEFLDLTQLFEDGMPGFRMKDRTGTATEFTAHVRPFMSHADSMPNYQGKASFESRKSVSRPPSAPISTRPAIATPAWAISRHWRFPHSSIAASSSTPVIAPRTGHCLPIGCHRPLIWQGRAVLINFGWDRYVGERKTTDAFPYVDRSGLEHLLTAGIALFGVDALNADNPADHGKTGPYLVPEAPDPHRRESPRARPPT